MSIKKIKIILGNLLILLKESIFLPKIIINITGMKNNKIQKEFLTVADSISFQKSKIWAEFPAEYKL
ncbi:hypothetical protein [Sporosalibacterium faouarense]|uniref:hypothetical protein n=1 Tax=Sporosalibacterium faouarense TaxID=516123 RepID=UPI001A9C68A7|nr:hypothetical protein [Sporosalibacterium faouarense]